MERRLAHVSLVLAAALWVCGCPEDNVEPIRDAGTTAADAGGDCPTPPVYTEDLAGCAPLATDYQPRVNGSADDAWPACISDDNAYHKVDPSISTIARIEAFDQIADKLWRNGRSPTAQDFIDARVLYVLDQGLDSRVQRREDIHYPAGAAACTDPAVADANPDRCAGPERLLPILNDSFARGAQGEAGKVHAARIEAALLWFLYLSSLSEAESCAKKAQDCDSCWAYYTGGTPRETPAGLARYVKALGPQTHERAYDGTLAVRCWRDLDSATPATDAERRTLARNQLDKALLRGMALVVRQRFTELACSDAEGKQARLAFLRALVPLLDREARVRNLTLAAALQAQVAEGVEPDLAEALGSLDGLFSCP
ncbi:MAG: hypothetical protein HY901_27730 [Deltaproteobacteria bacterium]|nr:hypothetical protein [Deltaproteobacteria bacterium]